MPLRDSFLQPPASALPAEQRYTEVVADFPHTSDSDDVDAEPRPVALTDGGADPIAALASARGEEYVAAAAELGLVVTDKGTFADPDHPARVFVSVDEAEAQLRSRFAQHGVNWAPDAQSA